MTDQPDEKSKIGQLKDLLANTLITQITDGVTVVDKEGGEHVVEVGAPVLAVAAKFIKDWADDMKADVKDKEQFEKLGAFLNRRRPDLAQDNKPN